MVVDRAKLSGTGVSEAHAKDFLDDVDATIVSAASLTTRADASALKVNSIVLETEAPNGNNWPSGRLGQKGTGHSELETEITAANVASLVKSVFVDLAPSFQQMFGVANRVGDRVYYFDLFDIIATDLAGVEKWRFPTGRVLISSGMLVTEDLVVTATLGSGVADGAGPEIIAVFREGGGGTAGTLAWRTEVHPHPWADCYASPIPFTTAGGRKLIAIGTTSDTPSHFTRDFFNDMVGNVTALDSAGNIVWQEYLINQQEDAALIASESAKMLITGTINGSTVRGGYPKTPSGQEVVVFNTYDSSFKDPLGRRAFDQGPAGAGNWNQLVFDAARNLILGGVSSGYAPPHVRSSGIFALKADTGRREWFHTLHKRDIWPADTPTWKDRLNEGLGGTLTGPDGNNLMTLAREGKLAEEEFERADAKISAGGLANVTGVEIVKVDLTSTAGDGTLGFVNATTSLNWLAPGNLVGADVPVGAGGVFTLTDASGKTLEVFVTAASLPGADQSDTIDISKPNVGRFIRFSGMTNSANNGVFPMQDRSTPGGNKCTFVNSAGVAETAPNGSEWHIIYGFDAAGLKGINQLADITIPGTFTDIDSNKTQRATATMTGAALGADSGEAALPHFGLIEFFKTGTNVTGVEIADSDNMTGGLGTLRYFKATDSLDWKPPGAAVAGPAKVISLLVAVGGNEEIGEYILDGGDGSKLVVMVDRALLPGSDQSDGITITNPGNLGKYSVNSLGSDVGDMEVHLATGTPWVNTIIHFYNPEAVAETGLEWRLRSATDLDVGDNLRVMPLVNTPTDIKTAVVVGCKSGKIHIHDVVDGDELADKKLSGPGYLGGCQTGGCHDLVNERVYLNIWDTSTGQPNRLTPNAGFGEGDGPPKFNKASFIVALQLAWNGTAVSITELFRKTLHTDTSPCNDATIAPASAADVAKTLTSGPFTGEIIKGRFSGPMALANNVLYFTAGTFLYAVNATTGANLAKFDIEIPGGKQDFNFGISVHQGFILVTAGASLQSATGMPGIRPTRIWKFATT